MTAQSQPAAGALRARFPGDNAWVGIDDLTIKFTWHHRLGRRVVWKSGGPSNVNWSPGEPNNAGGSEDCAEIYTTGNLNDIGCGAIRRIMCSSELPCCSPPFFFPTRPLQHSYLDIGHRLPVNWHSFELARLAPKTDSQTSRLTAKPKTVA